jgi:membrane-associated phospholipid phosphatase
MVVQSLNRPYPVSASMIALASLVPFYIFIAQFVKDGALHAPSLGLDRAIPLQPAWVIVYGSLYVFLIILPVFVVRQDEHIRRTVFAYLMVWTSAYFCFLVYPTIAPRPASVVGQGFFVWALKGLYAADPPYNCFPSIHVAHSFVSALTCYRVNRKVGIVASIFAALVAVSTLFTKQHYVLDVIAGGALAYAAYLVFLRSLPRETVPDNDRDLAQTFSFAVLGLIGLTLAGAGVAYKIWG